MAELYTWTSLAMWIIAIVTFIQVKKKYLIELFMLKLQSIVTKKFKRQEITDHVRALVLHNLNKQFELHVKLVN